MSAGRGVKKQADVRGRLRETAVLSIVYFVVLIIIYVIVVSILSI